MKKAILFLMATSLMISCSKSDDDNNNNPTPAKAKVKFTNATISSDTLKVQVDNTNLASASSLYYLGNSGYADVDTGSRNIAFRIASSNILLKDTTVTLSGNNYYSIYTTGIVTSPSVLVTSDNLTAPTTGNAKVRFINLSPGTLNEAAYVGSVKVDSNLTFRNVTPFREYAAGTYTITMADPNNIPAVKMIQNQQLIAGKIYTIILTGIDGGSGSAALSISAVGNN